MFRAKSTPEVRLPRSGKWRRPTDRVAHGTGLLREKADEELPRLGAEGCEGAKIAKSCGTANNQSRLFVEIFDETFRLNTRAGIIEGRRRHEKNSGAAVASRVSPLRPRPRAIASAADEVRWKRSTRPTPWPTNTRCASRPVSVRRVHAAAAPDRGSPISRVGARSSSFHRLPTGEIARSILLGIVHARRRSVPNVAAYPPKTDLASDHRRIIDRLSATPRSARATTPTR